MAEACRPRRELKSGRSTSQLAWCLLLLAIALLAACRSAPPPPSPSGGVYTSSTYHFRLTYPNGWQVNTPKGTTSSTTVPLEIVITRIDAQAAGGAQVSSFTVVVFNARDPVVATPIAQLHAEASCVKPATTTCLKPVTISGKTGYEDTPVTANIPGSQVSDTHTDYYLLTADYEYQISTDAVSGDNAGSMLQAMLDSFTVLS